MVWASAAYGSALSLRPRSFSLDVDQEGAIMGVKVAHTKEHFAA